MRSRSTTPMSLSRTLPLASVAARRSRPAPSTHSSWPAPSATTMTACARSASRRSRLRRKPRSPSRRSGTSGISTKFGVGRRERGVAGDEARVAPHQLDEADAVARARRLDVRAADRLHRGREGALEAEAAVDEVDVVVDRLRDPDDRDGQPAPLDLRDDLARAAQRAVAADHEQHADAERRERVDHLDRVLAAARRAEHGAALLVDLAHLRRAQAHRLVAVARDQPLEAVAEAEDLSSRRRRGSARGPGRA